MTMDIVRTKSNARFSNKRWLIAGAIILGIVCTYMLLNRSNASHVINSDALLIDQVQRGELVINVRGMGVLAPKDIRWLATTVAGKVERLHVKAGAIVRQGDTIIELSNPELLQELEETRWQLDELEAQTRAQKVALESQVLDQEAAVINEKLNYESASLTLNAQTQLLQQGANAVSIIDHEATKITVAQNKQRWDLAVQRLEKQKENAEAQNLANQARVNRMRKTLERVAHQVEQLTVRASIDAIVQEMPLELGQQVGSGSNLAKLAKRGDFIAELRIPENQIQNVVIGQSVLLDTRTSKFSGQVKRIDPAVNNGVVQVDVDLVEAAPKEARPELTVEGTISVAQLDNALFVKRPMFAKSFGDTFVYLVNPEDNTAQKHQVSFGQASTSFIEIKSGLTAGQAIIVSDVSNWDTHQKILIN